jgi:hypothetical protein
MGEGLVFNYGARATRTAPRMEASKARIWFASSPKFERLDR